MRTRTKRKTMTAKQCASYLLRDVNLNPDDARFVPEIQQVASNGSRTARLAAAARRKRREEMKRGQESFLNTDLKDGSCLEFS